jgi:hypothetical protein
MDPLEDTAPAFVEIAHRIVWATVATVDPEGRPWTRVLHPLWAWNGTELTGWVATGPTPLKVRHLAGHPDVSVTYWDATHDTVTANCRATWHHDDETCRKLWDAYLDAPEPVGYDPAIVPPWKDGPTSPAFAALRLDPWWLRVQPAAVMMEGDFSATRSWRRP